MPLNNQITKILLESENLRNNSVFQFKLEFKSTRHFSNGIFCLFIYFLLFVGFFPIFSNFLLYKKCKIKLIMQNGVSTQSIRHACFFLPTAFAPSVAVSCLAMDFFMMSNAEIIF